MFGHRIKLDKELYRKVKMYSETVGYASVSEFVTHTLEKEIVQLEDSESEEVVKKRLRGLGYIS